MRPLVVAAALLAGCATSPVQWPGEAEAREHFRTHRTVLEKLAARFDSDPELRGIEADPSGAVRVSRGESKAWPPPIVDDAELAALLGASPIESVRRDDDVIDIGLSSYYTTVSGSPVTGERSITYRLSYFRANPQYAESAYAPCPAPLPRHFEGSFGHCAISLDERWFLHYFWSSE